MRTGYDILNNNDYAMAFMSLFTFITAGPYHEFIEAAEAAIPVVGYLYHVSFYVRASVEIVATLAPSLRPPRLSPRLNP